MKSWKVWVGLVLLLGAVLASRQEASAVTVPEGMSHPGNSTFETTVVTTSTASAGTFGPSDLIYGFTLVADDAGDACGLYDVATLPNASTTQGVFIDELYQDTDNRQVSSDWPSPYRLVTDLTIVTNGAACYVYHAPKS